MDDDNIFDDDEVVDYQIFNDLEKEESGGGGCLSAVIIFLIPVVSVGYYSFC